MTVECRWNRHHFTLPSEECEQNRRCRESANFAVQVRPLHYRPRCISVKWLGLPAGLSLDQVVQPTIGGTRTKDDHKSAHTYMGGFQQILERKEAELVGHCESADGIAVEKSPDQMDEFSTRRNEIWRFETRTMSPTCCVR